MLEGMVFFLKQSKFLIWTLVADIKETNKEDWGADLNLEVMWGGILESHPPGLTTGSVSS